MFFSRPQPYLTTLRQTLLIAIVLVGARSVSMASSGYEKLLPNSYTGLGEKEHAFAALEKAYQLHDPRLILWLANRPEFEALRSDPRMKNLIRRVGLPSQ